MEKGAGSAWVRLATVRGDGLAAIERSFSILNRGSSSGKRSTKVNAMKPLRDPIGRTTKKKRRSPSGRNLLSGKKAGLESKNVYRERMRLNIGGKSESRKNSSQRS